MWGPAPAATLRPVMSWDRNAIDQRSVRTEPWDNTGLRLRLRGVTLGERRVDEELRRVVRERAEAVRLRGRRR